MRRDIPIINDGRLSTSLIAFFRTVGSTSPKHLIEKLGLSRYHSGLTEDPLSAYITIADDGQWIHLADSYYYLWYDDDFIVQARALARHYETLILGFPDTDNSFEIEYWFDGVIRRRYVWDDRGGWGDPPGIVVSDIGQAFPEEALIKPGQDPDEMVWKVAKSLGIETDYSRLKCSLYINPAAKLPSHNAGKGFPCNTDGLIIPDSAE